MKTIVIGQNEAARLTADSELQIATIGLLGCIAALLHGPAGTTLIHIDAQTDISFISRELELLGQGSTVRLFKNHSAPGELDLKVVTHLKNLGIPVSVEKLPPISPQIPFGIIICTAKGEHVPITEEMAIALACGDTLVDSIDSGPEDFQMRLYSQQIHGYLNPQLEVMPTIIFDNSAWQKGLELSKNDLVLLNYLFDVKKNTPRPEKIILEDVRVRVIKMLNNKSPAYQQRFGVEAEWYKKGSIHVLTRYNHQFPELLVRIYSYIQKNGLSFEVADESYRQSVSASPKLKS